MIAAIVGPRTLDTAQEVVAATKARVAGIPAFFRDGFTCSLAALIAAFHVVTTCARTGKRGRPRKPRCEPHPDLVYGQWVKQKKQGKLLTLSTRFVRTFLPPGAPGDEYRPAQRPIPHRFEPQNGRTWPKNRLSLG
jgi:hypothetical protein